jgi:hypothetical protein
MNELKVTEEIMVQKVKEFKEPNKIMAFSLKDLTLILLIAVVVYQAYLLY